MTRFYVIGNSVMKGLNNVQETGERGGGWVKCFSVKGASDL